MSKRSTNTNKKSGKVSNTSNNKRATTSRRTIVARTVPLPLSFTFNTIERYDEKKIKVNFEIPLNVQNQGGSLGLFMGESNNSYLLYDMLHVDTHQRIWDKLSTYADNYRAFYPVSYKMSIKPLNTQILVQQATAIRVRPSFYNNVNSDVLNNMTSNMLELRPNTNRVINAKVKLPNIGETYGERAATIFTAQNLTVEGLNYWLRTFYITYIAELNYWQMFVGTPVNLYMFDISITFNLIYPKLNA